jgi:hypothetical protein
MTFAAKAEVPGIEPGDPNGPRLEQPRGTTRHR